MVFGLDAGSGTWSVGMDHLPLPLGELVFTTLIIFKFVEEVEVREVLTRWVMLNNRRLRLLLLQL